VPIVLVIDDDKDIRSLIADALKPLGVITLEAGSIPEALACLSEQRIDLVLADVYVPGGTSFQIIWEIQHGQRPGTPIVLISGTQDRSMRAQAVAAGAADFLEKPIDRALLRARAKTLLELSALRDQQDQLAQFLIHDMKQPLTVIGATTEWLAEQAMPAACIEALSDIGTSVHRLRRMIDDLLAVAKAEQTALALDRVPIDVELFIADTVRAYHKLAESRGLGLQSSVDGLRSAHADPVLLGRVFGNLLENGMRYAATRILIRATIEEGRWAVFSVANDGPQIGASERSKIFEKFTQLSAGGSLGLGLYFCRLVLERHKGSIALTASEEWPVQFELRLPLTLG